MSVDSFIPEIWSAELLTALPTAHVFGQPGIVNNDYEGEIASFGDTVHIGSLSDPTIGTYVKNVTVIEPETLDADDQVLTIDQSKYFAFEVDDIDARQARNGGALLNTAAKRSAYRLAQTADTYMATLASTSGTVITATDVASANDAFALLRKLKLNLDTADVPTDGRYVIVSPSFYSLLLDDARFTDASKYGDSNAIRNGEVGRALGFAILASNNLAEGAGENASNFIVAGHSMAWTFAEQINKVEAYRPQNSFSDAVKGLHLYGAKVTRPEALVVVDVDVTDA